jgi:hypothetical protein
MRAAVRLPAPAPARLLTFDERLVLAGLEHDERIAVASARWAVDTAHIESVPLPEVSGPVVLPEALCPYSTPVAQLLWRAHARLQSGWCRGVMRDEAGAVCLLGAIQAEGGTSYGPESNLLYEVICRMDQRVASINRWNDQQRGPERPLLALERAARLASDRGL